jgi:Tfp pilus assembly protein PilN
MQEIDFLPERYREKHARRKARLIQVSILVIFALSVTAAAAGQLALRKSIEADLTRVQPYYTQAMSHHAELNDLRNRLLRAEEVAELYSHLQQHWPRTQLLAAVVEAMPESVALTELTIGIQAPPRAETRSVVNKSKAQADAQLSDAGRDLRDLRERIDGQVSVVDITGRSRDAAELHAFVAKLDQHPLIQSAKLESLESGTDGEEGTFVVRLTVRPD